MEFDPVASVQVGVHEIFISTQVIQIVFPEEQSEPLPYRRGKSSSEKSSRVRYATNRSRRRGGGGATLRKRRETMRVRLDKRRRRNKLASSASLIFAANANTGPDCSREKRWVSLSDGKKPPFILSLRYWIQFEEIVNHRDANFKFFVERQWGNECSRKYRSPIGLVGIYRVWIFAVEKLSWLNLDQWLFL